MNRKWWISVVLVAALLMPTAASAATPGYYEFGWEGAGISGTSHGGILIQNGVSYVSEHVVENFGLEMSWDESGERAAFRSVKREFAVRIGSKTAVMDGELVELPAAPFLHDDKLYIPASFVVRVFEGGPLRWDGETKTVRANGLRTFHSSSFAHEDTLYEIDHASGEIYVTEEQQKTYLLGTLPAPLFDDANIEASFETTPEGLLDITIVDNYGEPHINFQVFRLLIKDGELLRTSYVDYRRRFEENVARHDGQVLMINGTELHMIEDGTGEVVETVDLAALSGVEGPHFLEGMFSDVLLIRPNATGFLTLVDRETGESTLLYKELLSADEQQDVEGNANAFLNPGDSLAFVKREGDVLYFVNEDEEGDHPAELMYDLGSNE